MDRGRRSERRKPEECFAVARSALKSARRRNTWQRDNPCRSATHAEAAYVRLGIDEMGDDEPSAHDRSLVENPYLHPRRRLAGDEDRPRPCRATRRARPLRHRVTRKGFLSSLPMTNHSAPMRRSSISRPGSAWRQRLATLFRASARVATVSDRTEVKLMLQTAQATDLGENYAEKVAPRKSKSNVPTRNVFSCRRLLLRHPRCRRTKRKSLPREELRQAFSNNRTATGRRSVAAPANASGRSKALAYRTDAGGGASLRWTHHTDPRRLLNRLCCTAVMRKAHTNSREPRSIIQNRIPRLPPPLSNATEQIVMYCLLLVEVACSVNRT